MPKTAAPPESAEQQLAAHDAERARLEAELAELQAERERLVEQGAEFEALRALTTKREATEWEIELLARQRPALEAAVARERAAAWEQAWQDFQPQLAEAQTALAGAIKQLFAALDRAQATWEAAHRRGFAAQAAAEFVRPPPAAPVNDYSLREYVKHVEGRPAPPSFWPAASVQIELDTGFLTRGKFQPRKVPLNEIEGISQLAPPVRIKMLHGPVRTSNLAPGIARMHPGETHVVPARAGFVLVASGVAEVVDEQTALAG